MDLLAPEGIRGAPHALTPGTVQNVRIDHRRIQALVPEQRLDGSDVIAVLDEVGREGVTQRVASDLAFDARAAARLSDGPLEHSFVKVMPASDA